MASGNQAPTLSQRPIVSASPGLTQGQQDAKSKDVGNSGKPGKSAGFHGGANRQMAPQASQQQQYSGAGGNSANGRRNGRKGRSNYHNNNNPNNYGNQRNAPHGSAHASNKNYNNHPRRQIAEEDEFEVGSIFNSGSRKQNHHSLNHLLNFRYASRESDNQPRNGGNGYGRNGGGGRNKNQRGSNNRYGGGYRGGAGKGSSAGSASSGKKTREHYLQSNCQFLVRDNSDYGQHVQDPDSLVDWEFIEQVHLKTVGDKPTSCPICLCPPTAAKIARCGHVFCWPCILHYLALSDDDYRPCPICLHSSVKREDLKSVLVVQQTSYPTGSDIELRLMRRDRHSLFARPVAAASPTTMEERFPQLFNGEMSLGIDQCWTNMATMYYKLIVASKDQILKNVVGRERRELEIKYEEDRDEPESCFILEALSLLTAREEEIWEPPIMKGFDVTPLPPGASPVTSPANELPCSSGTMNETTTSPSTEQAIASLIKAKQQVAAPDHPNTGGEIVYVNYWDAPTGAKSGQDPISEEQELTNELEKLIQLDDQVTSPTEDSSGSIVDKESHGGARPRHASTSSDDTGEVGADLDVSVTAEDLDISSIQPANNIQNASIKRGTPKDTFYFYQSSDGQPIFLHALNVQMLVHEFGSLESCPHVIRAKILEKDASSMTEDMRGRLRYLRHLPLASAFEVAELDLSGSGLVKKETLGAFADQLAVRARRRARKRRDEKRREKRIHADEMRLMGRYPGPMVRIESNYHYPQIGSEAPTAPERLRQESGGGGSSVGSRPDSESSDVGPHDGSLEDPSQGPSQKPSGSAGWLNFAKVTREGSHRPQTLQTQPSALETAARNASNMLVLTRAGMTRRPRARDSESDGDVPEGLAPPTSLSLGDALEAALVAAKKSAKPAAGKEEEQQASGGGGKKKGKKNRGKTILLSGGAHMPCL